MTALNERTLEDFRKALEVKECSKATVSKYMAGARKFMEFCNGELYDKSQLVAFKQAIAKEDRAPATVNGMLAALNSLVEFLGLEDWCLRLLRVQHTTFARPEKELTQAEYERLVRTAAREGDERLSLLLQTICATGVRVGEVRAITRESIRAGQAEIRSKGKIRIIPLPKGLCRLLESYCKRKGIKTGCVFVTGRGNPMDRSNIWKSMKALAKRAGVALGKVFPHNLRHLFARTYYKRYKDIVRLADILGHSSVETTRIYTARSCGEQRRQMDDLRLLLQI